MIDHISTDSIITTEESQEALEEDIFVFPTSFTQERLWLLEQLRGEKAIYNLAGALHLQGGLQIPILKQALTEIVDRQEILRTTFPLIEGSPVQAIAPTLAIPMGVMDWQEKPEAQQWDEVKKFMEQEVQQPFDLAQGPLWRVKLIQLSPESSVLFLTMHHIISDGWSVGRFLQELSALYGAFLRNSPSPLPELEIQYADFAEWQRQWLTGEVLETQLKYWQQHLTGAPPTIDLPTDFPHPSVQTFRGTHQQLNLPPSLAKSLQSLSQRQGVTLFATLLAGLDILLAKWTGQRDLVVGTVIAGRNRTEIEPLIGCFMNFLGLRSQLSEAQTAQEFLKQVGQTVLDAYSHQDCPFEKVVEVINPTRKASQNPLYNVALLLQNFPLNLQFDETLEASPLSIETGASLLDMRFEVFAAADKLLIQCEYSTDLFKEETIQWLLEDYGAILKQLVEHPDTLVAEFKLSEKLQNRTQTTRARKEKNTLAIASTFTAEPIKESLSFWLQELELPFEIKFAPYNQVFQELLNQNSIFANNQDGVNVVLIRFEDLGKKSVNCLNQNHTSEFNSCENQKTSLEENLQDLLKALKSASGRSATPYLVCFCPPSPEEIAEPKQKAFYEQLEDKLLTSLEGVSGIFVVKTSDLTNLYPVEDYYDANGDELAHIPYTASGFISLGTIIARKLNAFKRKPYKVIVLDCDQTLWKGVCGEDGAEGVEITKPYQALQEFMLAQQNQGKILCLCSKNEAEDVFAVFDYHHSMPLKREHIVSWRINWQSKSENLKSLAQELQLGLDSFILVEDNPVECAEVQANCPEVLTVQLPQDCEQISQFLDHVWAFDTLKITEEDKTRTELYRHNVERERLRQETLTFEDFLAGLGLQVKIEPSQPHELARIAQLTQRTNQFNLTTIRRSEAEIQRLLDSGVLDCLVVSVKDRFGDYGLVGVILFEEKKDAIAVDTFLLSCRALGRGVEHQMLAQLGKIASERKLSYLEVPFIPTSKNQPAQNFLEVIGKGFKQNDERGILFRLPTAQMANVTLANSLTGQQPTPSKVQNYQPSHTSSNILNSSKLVEKIARELNQPQKILQVIEAQEKQNRPNLSVKYVAPRNQLEQRIAGVLSQVLKVEQLGVDDNFFALGGTSLEAAIAINRLQEQLGIVMHVLAIFDAPTIGQLAVYLQENYSDAVEKVLDITATLKPQASEITIDEDFIDQAQEFLSASFPTPCLNQNSNLSQNKPAIFILSPPRSGSTLLRAMLGGHPQLFAPPELYLLSFNSLKERAIASSGRNSWMAEGTIKAIMQINDSSEAEARQFMEECVEKNLTTKEFYHVLQELTSNQILVDKTPPYSYSTKILERAEVDFENPLYIHLARHPYGTIRSLEEVRFDLFSGDKLPQKLNPSVQEKAELIWLICHLNILKFLQKIPPERQYRIKFENLVQQPKTEIEKLCKFLELDFHQAMLEPYKQEQGRMTDGLHSASRMIGDIRFHQHQKIDANIAERWKQYYQADFLSDKTWQVAAAFNYKPIHSITEQREEGEI